MTDPVFTPKGPAIPRSLPRVPPPSDVPDCKPLRNLKPVRKVSDEEIAESTRLPRRGSDGKNPWPPNNSLCLWCQLQNGLRGGAAVFNFNPWALDRFDHCPRCGKERGPWESGPVYDWVWVKRSGRPAEGVAKPELIFAGLADVALQPVVRDFVGDLLARNEAGDPVLLKDIRRLLGLLQALSPVKIRMSALEEATGVPRRTLYDMSTKGRQVLAQKSPYDEGDDQEMNQGVIEHIDARFDRLEERLDQDMNDVFRAIMAFKETPAEEWEASLEKRKSQEPT